MEWERVTAVTGGGTRGAGYVVAPRLVLTTAEVAGARDEPVSVSRPGEEREFTGRVVWSAHDAALVLVEDPDWTPLPGGVRWGRAVTDAAVPRESGDDATVESGGPVFGAGLLTGIGAVPVAPLWTDQDFVATLAKHGAGAAELEAVEVVSAPPPTGPPGSPAGLLSARRAVVPFQGNETALDELRAWADEPGPGVSLLHGPSGAGKTRLAHELGRRLAGTGFAVAWPPATATEDDLAVLARTTAPLLVIVDDAQTRGRQLSTLLRALARRPPRVKVLLLARTATSWWHDLTLTEDKACAFVLTGARVRDLGMPADVQRSYRAAVTAFADALDRPEPATSSPIPDSATTLTVHLTALADVLDPAGKADDTSDPVDRVLAHERRHWRDTAPDVDEDTLTDTLAATILRHPPTPEDADDWLARVPGLADRTPEQRGKVGSWLADNYPADDPRHAFGHPRPDRLAERLVAGALAGDVAHTLAPTLTDADAVRLLTVCANAASGADQLESALTRLVREHPGTLAVAAQTVRTRTASPAPLRRALELFAEDGTLDDDTLDALIDAEPDRAPSRAHDRAHGPIAIAFARQAVDRRWRVYQDSPAAETAAPLARALRVLAFRLAGEPDAIAAGADAIQLYRALAERDAEIHLPHLVTCLTNQADLLAANPEWREEALAAVGEAAEIGRRLAEKDPDAHLPLLARNLDIRASWLGDLGRGEEALTLNAEAVELYRRLADTEPSAYLPELAKRLSNRASLLCGLGRWAEALPVMDEAVATQRPLTQRFPGTGLPDLMGLLDNRGLVQHAVGKPDEAMVSHDEAIALAGEFTAHDPAARLAGLARKLTDRSRRLEEQRHLPEALAASEEALRIHRRLAARDPEGRLVDLSSGLYNHAISLRLVGRTEEALATIGEAVEIDRRLVARDAVTHLLDLAGSLSKQAAWLGELGHWERARAAINESVKIRRLLAWESPDEHLAELERAADLRQAVDRRDTEALLRYYPANFAINRSAAARP